MIIVSARVYKRFSLIPHGFSHAVSWDFQLYTVRTLFNGYRVHGNVFKLWFMWCF